MRRLCTSSAARWGEAAVIGLLTAAAVAEISSDPRRTGPLLLHVGVVALLGGALLLRRRLGAGGPVLGGAAVVVQCVVGFVASAGELVLYLLLAGTAAATRTPRSQAAALTAVTAGFVAVLLADPTMETLQSALPALVMFGAAVSAGLTLRRRAAASEAHARESEQRAARLLEDERSRIARELHDVVTHSLSVVVVQAGAARLDADPEQAAHLAAIESTARSALDEMRRLLGVLRGTEGTGLQPQPGLDQLPALVEQVAGAGLDVVVQHDGDRQPLPPGLDLAAYRVVQEALTNVIRHARAHQVEVRLSWEATRLVLVITDDGAGDAGPPGRGLVGMTERVALYGGAVTAGPRAQGGFAVRAELPLLRAPVPTP